MRVAILGATGFVGAPILTEALARPELALTAVVRRPDAIAASERVKVIEADVLDPAALSDALRGHDAVIHAWHPGRAAANNVRTRDPSYSLYSLTRVRDSETRYVLMQQFESWESQLAHQSYDYVLAAMPAMAACLAAPPEIDWLEVIA